jgi:hypothetical protein
MFRSLLFDHLQGSSSVLSAVTTCETTKHPTDKYIRHAHTQTTYSHIPNKQLDEAKQAEK